MIFLKIISRRLTASLVVTYKVWDQNYDSDSNQFGCVPADGSSSFGYTSGLSRHNNPKVDWQGML